MLFRQKPKGPQVDAPAVRHEAAEPPPEPLDVVLAYHAATRHHPYRYARSLGYMDWDNQPNPFRRYEGTRLLPLDEAPVTPEPGYDAIFTPGQIPPQPLDRRFVSQLFYDSLALSAWKEYADSRWSLRVNPSSGNLHPTEGYLVSGAVPGLLDRPAVCHYAPLEHGLEVRRDLPDEQWQALAGQLPPGGLLVGLTSITWREAWKYGERAFRYCQHDVGHAVAAVTLAAAALGWEARLLDGVADAELAVLLGVAEQSGPDADPVQEIEAEHPDCLLALYPYCAALPVEMQQTFHLPPALLNQLRNTPPAGRPNQLSADHHPWPIIDAVSEATELTSSPTDAYWYDSQPQPQPSSLLLPPSSLRSARQIIRQRRSAVDMDGVTSIDRDTFLGMLARLLPGQRPFTALPWRPSIHLALFVHRVAGLEPGLYFLVRDPAQRSALQAALHPDLAWQRPAGCPAALDLFLLQPGDARSAAQAVSCGQEIAAGGCFAVGMLADYEAPLRRFGPWFYKRLHWEAGAVGQVLYLEAEAASVRGTGIGCFFDDSMHQLLGLPGYRTRTEGSPSLQYQTLYHFTVGGPVEDPRLRTAPAYAHRKTGASEQSTVNSHQ